MPTFYIDPDVAVNGSGTTASPYKTWASVTPLANNTYLQKRGTRYTGAVVHVNGQASSAATPLTISAYFYPDGSDEPSLPLPIFDHNGGSNGAGAVMVSSSTNVIITKIAATNSLAAYGSGVRVRRSSSVLVSKCDVYGNIHGISLNADQVGDNSDVEVSDNYCHNNSGSGILFGWGTVANARFRRLTIARNEVCYNGTNTTAYRSGGIMHENERSAGAGNADSTSAAYSCYDVIVNNNKVYKNKSYAITVYAIRNDTWVSSVSRNIVYENGFGSDMDTHCVWVGGCFGTLVERNVVYSNFGLTGGSIGTGVGIFLDFNANGGVGGDSCIVRRNIVYNQWRGVTLSNKPGPGIAALAQTNAIIESNIVNNCRNGITVTGALSSGSIIRNNTILGIGNSNLTTEGYGILIDEAPNTTIINNSISNVRSGIHTMTGLTGIVNNKNNIFDAQFNRTSTSDWITTSVASANDPTDLFIDPKLSPKGRLTTESPLVGAGSFTSYSQRDFEGKQRQKPPSIGAYDIATFLISE